MQKENKNNQLEKIQQNNIFKTVRLIQNKKLANLQPIKARVVIFGKHSLKLNS